jgi:hypothetical protein
MDFPGFPWIFHNNPKHRILVFSDDSQGEIVGGLWDSG